MEDSPREYGFVKKVGIPSKAHMGGSQTSSMGQRIVARKTPGSSGARSVFQGGVRKDMVARRDES